jgi:hypothetical protein
MACYRDRLYSSHIHSFNDDISISDCTALKDRMLKLWSLARTNVPYPFTSILRHLNTALVPLLPVSLHQPGANSLYSESEDANPTQEPGCHTVRINVWRIKNSVHSSVHTSERHMTFRSNRTFRLCWGQLERLKPRKKMSKCGFRWKKKTPNFGILSSGAESH